MAVNYKGKSFMEKAPGLQFYNTGFDQHSIYVFVSSEPSESKLVKMENSDTSPNSECL